VVVSVYADLPSSAAPKEEGRLLVVDDEARLRELFAMILGEAGWQVDVARHGDDTLTKAVAAAARLHRVAKLKRQMLVH
jgi:CheY-like chemotaxis protein